MTLFTHFASTRDEKKRNREGEGVEKIGDGGRERNFEKADIRSRGAYKSAQEDDILTANDHDARITLVVLVAHVDALHCFVQHKIC